MADSGAVEDGDEGAYETLEKDFKQVLAEIENNDTLDKFRDDYKKVYAGYAKSRENERRLMMRCRDLKSEIVANGSKLAEVMRTSKEEKSSIVALKKEIEKAWKLVDVSQEKESRSKEVIDQLQYEMDQLQAMVKEKSGIGITEYSVQELVDLKEKLTSDLKLAMADVAMLRQNLTDAITKQKEEESYRTDAEQKISELQNEIQQSEHDAQRELFRKNNLEKEVMKFRKTLEERQAELVNAEESTTRMQERCRSLEEKIRELEGQNDRSQGKLESQRTHSNGIQQKLEEQYDVAETLRREINDQQQLIKTREDELKSCKQDQSRVRQLRDNLNNKLQLVDKEKAEVERERDDVKAQVAGLERELEQLRKDSEAKRRKCEELTRERDKLDRQVRIQTTATDKQADMVKVHAQGVRTLESEVRSYQDEAIKQRKTIAGLERERDTYYHEFTDKVQDCTKLNELLKVKEIQIIDHKKRIADSDVKRQQQQNLYEAVRSDRNMFSKSLQEKQDELKELKQRLVSDQRLIEQLKDDLASKDTALVKEHSEHQRLEKEKEALRAELLRLKEELREANRYADDQMKEHQKLQRLITESDAERTRQRKELDQVLNERDVLGTQLIRRNDELSLLHEKLRVQQAVLDKGEMQYVQRLSDIRILRLAIKQARNDRAAMGRNVANFAELKQEVFRTQRELVREQARCKALELELQSPLNVHRWRTLKGTDPSKFELINKVQTLQKKLIGKTEEVVEKELAIKDKEKLYVELKQILARQPGPEVEQQVVMYQQTLKAKTKQLKAMAAELNMFEAQISEAKMESERLGRELQEVKKKYFMMKKKEQQKRERDSSLGQAGLPPIQSHAKTNRFTGGGFNLKTSQSRIVQ
ncbi:cilia- and flagella-associated protein 58-like [Sycon ciliatum]|uniref:cilia- and flagella-associated protein 58-like n=1 Tax=Sycon ciliatum TaxID=27933 RepID=UPI0020AE78CF|eukprot:scpid25831/ scgid25981/ Coiled-coil domain-containing protein 147